MADALQPERGPGPTVERLRAVRRVLEIMRLVEDQEVPAQAPQLGDDPRLGVGELVITDDDDGVVAADLRLDVDRLHPGLEDQDARGPGWKPRRDLVLPDPACAGGTNDQDALGVDLVGGGEGLPGFAETRIVRQQHATMVGQRGFKPADAFFLIVP